MRVEREDGLCDVDEREEKRSECEKMCEAVDVWTRSMSEK